MKEQFFSGMVWRREGCACTGFWFRVFGWGLHVSTRRRADALFSERYGFRRAAYLCGLRFEVLRPIELENKKA